eukprot:CAMPEP_0170967822 /NCGR_PEP_ID=MMETSP0735-20130129/42870_1 /TAXON_ID=186038 /ORGANISM="Fragilariopsis kerguelensis, Strain L26-C5" /LENGTH=134 /DNA_ID=CAMNT_0011386691 /DNA_START=36 /DNA_END=437 /DNA_ORIENTATION=+
MRFTTPSLAMFLAGAASSSSSTKGVAATSSSATTSTSNNNNSNAKNNGRTLKQRLQQQQQQNRSKRPDDGITTAHTLMNKPNQNQNGSKPTRKVTTSTILNKLQILRDTIECDPSIDTHLIPEEIQEERRLRGS